MQLSGEWDLLDLERDLGEEGWHMGHVNLLAQGWIAPIGHYRTSIGHYAIGLVSDTLSDTISSDLDRFR